jgi:predicted PurR-regulated permease PerM
MDEEYYGKTITLIMLLALIVLSFFLLQPILLSAILGIILAFVFMPIYKWLYKKTNSKNLSATILCILLVLLIVIPFWFLTPILINQSIKIYLAAQKADFVTPLTSIFPDLFATEEFSAQVGPILQSFVTKTANSGVNLFAKLILDSPILMLQSLVVLFAFFFMLRDEEDFLNYIKSILPFSETVHQKLFKQSKEITFSVLYGQIIVGILQGLLVGIGFFLFGVPNALLLTLFAAAAGVFPVIGTTIIWFPVAVYFFIGGGIFSAIGITIFGILSTVLDNFLKPMIVSRRTQMHSSLVLFGMVGGILFFGIIGFILGPLILAYLLIIIEVYRNKRSPGIFSKKEK